MAENSFKRKIAALEKRLTIRIKQILEAKDSDTIYFLNSYIVELNKKLKASKEG